MQPLGPYLSRWIDTDLDTWTRTVVRRHFDPDTGSPYWLKRAAELDFDPLDITRYEELTAFGPFDFEVLRDGDPTDLVPLAVPRPLAGPVWETGATTGRPCRIIYTAPMIEHRAQWRLWSYLADGFEPGRTWVHATASGPHLVAHGVQELADTMAARVHPIDLDPGWVKSLLREGKLKEAEAYTAHTVKTAAASIEINQADYVYTTPALLTAIQRERPELLRRLSGVRLGGTRLTAAMYRSFRDGLGEGIVSALYGNTLGSSIGLPIEQDGAVVPYLPPFPQVTVAIVDPSEWTRQVDYGDTGQVRLTILQEDLFLPNVLDRDQALRLRADDRWPSDVFANVGPLQQVRANPEGLY